MSGWYESIKPDWVIIFYGFAAYKLVFDVTTQQTMSPNERPSVLHSQDATGPIYEHNCVC